QEPTIEIACAPQNSANSRCRSTRKTANPPRRSKAGARPPPSAPSGFLPFPVSAVSGCRSSACSVAIDGSLSPGGAVVNRREQNGTGSRRFRFAPCDFSASRQVEHQHFRWLGRAEPKDLLLAHGGAVSLAKGLAVQSQRPAGDLDPGVPPRRQPVCHALARRQGPGVEV